MSVYGIMLLTIIALVCRPIHYFKVYFEITAFMFEEYIKMKKWMKSVLCSVIAGVLLLAGSEMQHADAASNIITVRSYKSTDDDSDSGRLLYSGNDLQEAMDAAEDWSVVTIGRRLSVSEQIEVKVQILLVGFDYINFSGTGKFLLSGTGAICLDTNIPIRRVGAKNSDYSSIDSTIEENYYIYFLQTKEPSLDGYSPNVKTGNGIYGAKVDDAAGVIYMDAVSGGITTADLAERIAMEADYAEGVDYSFKNTINIDGRICVANGTTVTAKAYNNDCNVTATRTYKIVLLGDVNGNGRADSADASMISRFVSGTGTLEGDALTAADVDQDGAITKSDAEQICKKYVRSGSYRSSLQS